MSNQPDHNWELKNQDAATQTGGSLEAHSYCNRIDLKLDIDHSFGDHCFCKQPKASPVYGSHFRYVVAVIVLISVAMITYAQQTLYITSIEMVFNDVLTTGLTRIKTKHLADHPNPLLPNLDPTSTNVAPPGTCPIQSRGSKLASSFSLVDNLIDQLPNEQNSSPQQFATGLIDDAKALIRDIRLQLSKGQLVEWSIEQRGLMFAAQKVGNLLAAVPMSQLGLRYGSKAMISLSLFASTLHAFLWPHIAGHSPFWFAFLFELVSGGLCSSIVSVMMPLTAAWFLPQEASAFLALIQVASLTGMSLTDSISSQMMAHKLHWSSAFYLAGGIMTIVTLAWQYFGADRPEKSRFVSHEELVILRQSVANRSQEKRKSGDSMSKQRMLLRNEECLCLNEDKTCPAKQLKRVPQWTAIASCPTIWALVAINLAGTWTQNTDALWPTFFSAILHWEPALIGLITSLKGIVAIVYGTLFAYATRNLATDRPFNMSLINYRRFSAFMTTSINCLSLLLMISFDCSLVANSFSVILSPVIIGFNVISFHQMPLDMSPEDSGLISSWIRLMAFGEALAVPISGYVLSAATSPEHAHLPSGDRGAWHLVWLLGIAIKVSAFLIFMAFARLDKPKCYSRLQPVGQCKMRVCHK